MNKYKKVEDELWNKSGRMNEKKDKIKKMQIAFYG